MPTRIIESVITSYPEGRRKNRKREYPSGSRKAKVNIAKEQKIASESKQEKGVMVLFMVVSVR